MDLLHRYGFLTSILHHRDVHDGVLGGDHGTFRIGTNKHGARPDRHPLYDGVHTKVISATRWHILLLDGDHDSVVRSLIFFHLVKELVWICFHRLSDAGWWNNFGLFYP